MNVQLVRQQGQKLGLKGKSLDDFVNTTKMISDAKKLKTKPPNFGSGVTTHIGMGSSETLGEKGKAWKIKAVGKLASHIMAPFKSWQAGNFNRLFTDKI